MSGLQNSVDLLMDNAVCNRLNARKNIVRQAMPQDGMSLHLSTFPHNGQALSPVRLLLRSFRISKPTIFIVDKDSSLQRDSYYVRQLGQYRQGILKKTKK